jgi:alpha-beta hydrolase superfamily lysophospholipase
MSHEPLDPTAESLRPKWSGLSLAALLALSAPAVVVAQEKPAADAAPAPEPTPVLPFRQFAPLTESDRDALAADPDADRVFVIEKSRGPTREPRHGEVYTHRTWWSTRGPSATAAMAFRQIGQVWAPILMVQGTADELVEPWEPDGLATIARRAGNADVEVALLPDAGHLFKGHEVPLADLVVRWLREHA